MWNSRTSSHQNCMQLYRMCSKTSSLANINLQTVQCVSKFRTATMVEVKEYVLYCISLVQALRLLEIPHLNFLKWLLRVTNSGGNDVNILNKGLVSQNWVSEHAKLPHFVGRKIKCISRNELPPWQSRCRMCHITSTNLGPFFTMVRSMLQCTMISRPFSLACKEARKQIF